LSGTWCTVEIVVVQGGMENITFYYVVMCSTIICRTCRFL